MMKVFEVASLEELRLKPLALFPEWHRDAPSKGKYASANQRTSELRGKLDVFSNFVWFRLRELKLWPSRFKRLSFVMSDGTELKPGPRHRTRQRVIFAVTTPTLPNNSDESLVGIVSRHCAETFATFVPGAQLPVLADEFLSAGSRLSISHQATHKGITAELTIGLSMRRVEASLETCGRHYRVMQASNDGWGWKDLFGSMTVSSRRVEIRAINARGHGRGRAVRRFVVDLKTNKVVQKWEFSGRGGLPVRGTGLRKG